MAHQRTGARIDEPAGGFRMSFEAGFCARYGMIRFYDPRRPVSATRRRGIESDTLTLEERHEHAEATGGLVNAAPGALVRMGMAGDQRLVVRERRQADRHPARSRLSADRTALLDRCATLRAYGNYGDLAARDGTPVPTATDRVDAGAAFFSRQTVSVSYIGYRFPGIPRFRGSASLSYTLKLRAYLASLTLSTYKDFLQHNAQGVFLTASFGLGNNTAINASVGRQNGQSTYNLNAQRPPDYAGGWGWACRRGARARCRTVRLSAVSRQTTAR